MYNNIPELAELPKEDAEKVYKKAVELLKQENPGVFLKGLMLAGFGGGIGVLIGSIIKDVVLKIQGLNLKAFLVMGFCAMVGGVIGGIVISTRLETKIKSKIPQAKEELGL